MCLKCGVVFVFFKFFLLFFYLLSCPVILQVSYLDLYLVVELVRYTFLKVIFSFFIHLLFHNLVGHCVCNMTINCLIPV